MRIFNTFLASVLVLAFGFNVHAQSAKSFLVPKKPVDKCIFSEPDAQGNSSTFNTAINYTDDGDTYVISTVKFMRLKPMLVENQTVRFMGGEAKLIHEHSISVLTGESDKKYNPAKTLFKVPAKGQKAYWVVPSDRKDIQKCVSELTSVNVEGNILPAVKVTKDLYTNGKLVVKYRVIDYYVKGIGFYKTVLAKDNSVMVILGQMYSEAEDIVSVSDLSRAAVTGKSNAQYEPPASTSSKTNDDLEISGWRFNTLPKVEAIDEMSGAIRFKIIINDEGKVESVFKVVGTVSPEQEKICRDALSNSSFMYVGDNKAQAATGFYNFKFSFR